MPTLEEKDAMRESRLNASTSIQERIYKEWRKVAYEKCDPEVKAYWVCRQEEGFKVVFKCRDRNDAMKNCLASVMADKQGYNKYKEKRMDDARKAAAAEEAAAAAAAGGAGK